MRRSLFVLLILVTAAFVTAPAAQACNSLCKDQGGGCKDCDFAILCNNCWCIPAGQCNCSDHICVGEELPSDDFAEEGSSIDTLVAGIDACGPAGPVLDAPVDALETVGNMQVRELRPRT